MRLGRTRPCQISTELSARSSSAVLFRWFPTQYALFSLLHFGLTNGAGDGLADGFDVDVSTAAAATSDEGVPRAKILRA